MQSTTAIATTLTLLIATLKKAPKVAEQINQKCQQKGLPPALIIQTEPFDIEGNPDYRFEGFGIVAGLTPKLSFWVHYKPDSPLHVEIGRFLVPFSILELANIETKLGI